MIPKISDTKTIDMAGKPHPGNGQNSTSGVSQ
ncbi:hypothetical protein MPF_0340 [Methanohalophilus portucalensis FDF-1]|uniref:Uncharacterized protein n=1 Tax=Methanohalophilus portucalensis FDF-1 TaxID=523843 RepID=A0A1L9C4U1_9EURY|nr:hypothetical protein MPF_0340 [Methanohalophilus portucalensis FDF-1]